VPLCALVFVFTVPRPALMHSLLFMAISLTAAGLINSQVKSLVGRPRPVTHFGAKRAAALENGTDLPSTPGPRSLVPHVVGPRYRYRSFPSGHANTSFAAATVLYIVCGGWWNLGFAVAAGVAYSRVYCGAHFPLDCIAGAFAGMITVPVVSAAYRRWVNDFTRLTKQRSRQ
jgi:membrane-associated phospholipid phosphatase